MLFVITISLLWISSDLSIESLMALAVGGFFAALFGFFDDIFNLHPFVKLFFQFILAVWAVFWLEGGIFAAMGWFPFWLSSIFISVLLIWMMNLYNFMDGIDGMAGSTAVFVTFFINNYTIIER